MTKQAILVCLLLLLPVLAISQSLNSQRSILKSIKQAMEISQSLNSQRSILLSIKQQWGNLSAMFTWIPTTSPCSWAGIQCSMPAEGNSTAKSVTGINLYDAEISSSIPASICNLTTLKTLDLGWNYIPGGFPTVLYRCSALTYLNLSGNFLAGPIPDDVGTLLLASLQYLDLSGNNFTGKIPKSIGGLRELKTLNLAYNLLDGTYPSEISNLSKLEDLRLDFNPFYPMALPSEWGSLKSLKFLSMRECNIVGHIPESFGGLISLQYLELEENGLVGKIPDGLFLLKSLSVLTLYSNDLSGEIPRSVQALNLTDISLDFNKLSGSIPEDFGKLKRLGSLSLPYNNLSGEIPASIGLLPELEYLFVTNNTLSGHLPPELGSHSTFRYLDIRFNQFSGPLPENLCSRASLLEIAASSNHLSGEIPKSIGSCPTLYILMINDNNFTGEIPDGVWTLQNLNGLMFSNNRFNGHLPDRIAKKLYIIDLNNNKFTGPIPTTIGSWSTLVVLHLSGNELSGPIPTSIGSLTNLTDLDLSSNKISGPVPTSIGSLTALFELDLSNNKLSGPIPTSIGSLTTLFQLNLSSNELSGPIPTTIGLLSRIYHLDLSSNEFSGPIPADIGSLSTLTTLDMSSNDLSGEIPAQFYQLELTSLNLSNNKLSGEILYSLDGVIFSKSFMNNNLCTSYISQKLNLPRCSSSLPSFLHKHLALVLVLSMIASAAVMYSIVFAIRKIKWRDNKDTLPTWNLTSFQRLEFTEANIISSLSEQQVIGTGGSGKVYRVQVDNSGYSVAVKRIWNNNQVNNAQFLAEVETLGNIRHANIVKLLCCISSEMTKLLVYEYLENQSLDRWLHRRRRLELEGRGVPLHVLEWSTRLKIAIGAAQGLCYMHHDIVPPIIHRDIKSSNILLDSEFNAKIADFGLARMTVKQGELHTMSSVAGTFGYLAPEYRQARKVNEKIDVYSFGVVLLELATGKEPNSRDETLNLADSSWKHCCEDKPIVDGLDMEVMQHNNLEQMTTVFKLGIMCTNPLPNSRPSMKDVLHVLCRSSPLEETEDDRTNEDISIE